MEKAIKIEAKNKKRAVDQAIEQFADEYSEDVNREDLEIELIEKKKGFFGLRNKKNVYRVGIKQYDQAETSQKIDDMAEEIAIDGEFDIKVVGEGVMVKVVPPEGDGDKAHYQQVKTKLEEKEIVEVDWQILQEAVNEAEDEWIKIAPRKPELDRDASVEVNISDDKLKAFLDYEPALGGKKIDMKDLKNLLQEAGVRYGIKEEKLKSVIESRDKVGDYLIAEGKEPEKGKDGEIVYHFEEKEEAIGTKREDGSMDFYNLGLINNVQPGDVLVTVKEPEPGTPGMGVDGEEIPSEEPEEKALPSGKNVEARDEKTLVAAIEGQVVREKNRVNVLPIHEVNGNVDLNTGNIDFVGNVLIKGDVLEGFEVNADGNVEIRGNVNGTTIKSGGEVVIHKGFVGKNKGEIEAQGDVKVKFVENGQIRTRGSVTITDAVMHSTVIAAEKIDVTKKKGLVVGGKCRAGEEIKANIVGSSFATETALEAGVDPESKERVEELKEQLKKNNKNILKMEKGLKLLREMKKKGGKLPPDKEKTFHQLQETKDRLEEKMTADRAELEGLNEKMNKLEKGKIEVNRKVFPGVKIVIGKSQYNVHNQMSRTAFIEEAGEIRQITHD